MWSSTVLGRVINCKVLCRVVFFSAVLFNDVFAVKSCKVLCIEVMCNTGSTLCYAALYSLEVCSVVHCSCLPRKSSKLPSYRGQDGCNSSGRLSSFELILYSFRL